MPIALDETERALADAAAELCRRRAPLDVTRSELAQYRAGGRGRVWDEVVSQGFHAVHLPDSAGGGGSSLTDLAIVAEQFGRHLLPGPWLPTMLASGVLRHAIGDLADDLRQEFCNGSTGAVVLGGLTGAEDGGSLRVSGLSDPALGLPGAEIILARAEVGDRTIWFRLPADAGKLEISPSTDLTVALGTVELDSFEIADEHQLAVDDDGAELVLATVLCAQSAGIAAWALDTAVEHLRTRHQFGKPIGSFQALQHRAAEMLVRTECAVAAAWDASRAELQSPDQWRIAAAQATVTGPAPVVDVVFDFISMLGALGITWEHDVHLYLRRAMTIAGLAGPVRDAARRLGAEALDVERAATLDDRDRLPDVRVEVGQVLDEFLAMPAEDERHLQPWGRWTGGARQRLLAAGGLIAPHLAPPYGRGAGPEEQAVIADEFVRRGLSQPTLIVGDWALATLVAHGTEQQRDRFADPTLRGEIIWCQLFSEPEAGSDLAAVRTRATRVEGGWRLTGQKVWNSRACEAQWGICLARSDGDSAKHAGLTYFLVDMSSPGVEARPIQQSNGHAELAEVFLDDVFVPDDCVVGEPGEGWRLAVTTLSSERMNMGSRLKYGAASLVKGLLGERGVRARRDDVLQVVGECTAREICLASMNLRTVLGLMSGREMSAETSVNKVLNATAQRDGSRALLQLLGPLAMTDANEYVADYLGMPAMLFGGGTIEVQLNVIAGRVLRLPRG